MRSSSVRTAFSVMAVPLVNVQLHATVLHNCGPAGLVAHLQVHGVDGALVGGAGQHGQDGDARTRVAAGDSIETLQELSAENMYLFLGRTRKTILGRFSLANVGHRMTRYLAGRFGADREEGTRVCSREAARLLGLRSFSGFTPGERLAWERWAPLVVNLPGLPKWTAVEKKALVAVVRAKGGQRESDFVLLFNRHRGLQRALGRMGE